MPSILTTILENMADKEMKRFYTKKLTSATEQSAHEKEFAKLTFSAGDVPRIVDQPPLIFHYGDKRDQEMRAERQKNAGGLQGNADPGPAVAARPL